MSEQKKVELTEEQLERIRINREKALQRLKQTQEKKQFTQIQSQPQSQQTIPSSSTPPNDSQATFDKTLTCLCYVNDSKDVCNQSPVDEVLYTHFQEQVCKSCKYKSNEWKLINKTESKAQYLIPDDAFTFLKHMLKANPHQPTWAPMKLYLTKHIQQAALNRFETLEALEQEKQLRQTMKYEREETKTKDFFKQVNAQLLSSEEPSSFSTLLTNLTEETNNQHQTKKKGKQGTKRNLDNPEIKQKKQKPFNDLLSSITQSIQNNS